jgi:hypothetical protein
MKSLTMAMTALLIGMSVPALAQDRDDRGRHEREGSRYQERDRDDSRAAGATRAGWLSEAQVTQKLAEAGLKAGHIKIEHGRYEVYATDTAGVRVKVYVNPTTGAVIRRERGHRS